jgi:hypothetical protein
LLLNFFDVDSIHDVFFILKVDGNLLFEALVLDELKKIKLLFFWDLVYFI